jgi:hypothetical protein
MKLTAKPLAALIFLILFGGIAVTTAMNWWQTSSSKVPAQYADGKAAGQYNPADIRGSYTFGEISSLFAVPLTDLQRAFRIPAEADSAEYQVKSLESQFAGLPFEIGTSSVRLFVAYYKGLPFELTDEIYLPLEAVEILKKAGNLTFDQTAYLDAHAVSLDPAGAIPVQSTQPPTNLTTPSTDQAESPPVTSEHTAPERMVTGKTTFKDMLDWGVTQEAIEQVLGEAMPDASMAVKDYFNARGEEFSTFKTDLQALVDQVE